MTGRPPISSGAGSDSGRQPAEHDPALQREGGQELAAGRAARAADRAGVFAQAQVKLTSRRNRMAGERDRVADEREALADQRERAADKREALADQRERAADKREARLNEWEARLNEREARLDEREARLDLAPENRAPAGRDDQARVKAMIALYAETRARAGAAAERAEAARRRFEASRRRYEASRQRALTDTACAYAELGSEMAAITDDHGLGQQEVLARSRDAVARSKTLRASAPATDRAGGAGRAAP